MSLKGKFLYRFVFSYWAHYIAIYCARFFLKNYYSSHWLFKTSVVVVHVKLQYLTQIAFLISRCVSKPLSDDPPKKQLGKTGHKSVDQHKCFFVVVFFFFSWGCASPVATFFSPHFSELGCQPGNRNHAWARAPAPVRFCYAGLKSVMTARTHLKQMVPNKASVTRTNPWSFCLASVWRSQRSHHWKPILHRCH